MKILIDIGHPAHVHLFKNFAWEMMRKGHHVHFTIRNKEFEKELLETFGLPYTTFGVHYSSKLGKIWGLLKFTSLMLWACFKFKPDIFLSHGSMYSAFTAFILRKPNIAMEDTGNREQVRLYLPFTKAVLTSTSFPYSYGYKQILYEGYHELAYLHPNYFRPDKSVISALGLREGEIYFILRFVSWDASHDIGAGGLTLKQKRELIHLLSQNGKVFISAEKKLDPEFESYKFPLAPEKMHDALSHAKLFVGEGATMASECAVLGTPAVYINSLQRGYTTEQEKKYGLVYNFSTGEGVLPKVKGLLQYPDLNEKAKAGHKKLLSEKIDLTAFLVWFIENWPESFRIMKKDPDFQFRFK